MADDDLYETPTGAEEIGESPTGGHRVFRTPDGETILVPVRMDEIPLATPVKPEKPAEGEAGLTIGIGKAKIKLPVSVLLTLATGLGVVGGVGGGAAAGGEETKAHESALAECEQAISDEAGRITALQGRLRDIEYQIEAEQAARVAADARQIADTESLLSVVEELHPRQR